LGSGVYWFNAGGATYQNYWSDLSIPVPLLHFAMLLDNVENRFCDFENSDMTTDGGGWNMVLNLDTRCHSLCSIILLTLVLDNPAQFCIGLCCCICAGTTPINIILLSLVLVLMQRWPRNVVGCSRLLLPQTTQLLLCCLAFVLLLVVI
jgi:hypothetical protein